MSYFQALMDFISMCISCFKLILLNLLVVFLTWFALTNGFRLYSGLSRFLWKRGSDAEEEADRLDFLRRQEFLYQWGQQEARSRKEEERGHNEVGIYRSAETLRRRIRVGGVEEQNMAKRLLERRGLEDELERLTQKRGEQREEEEQLQFEQQKLSRRIARKREDQEELRHEQKRLSQKIEMMEVFHRRSGEEQSKETMRKEKEEELQRNKEILARGNERRMALEEQRRTAMENKKNQEAQEERRKAREAEYQWDGFNWEGPDSGPNDEQDLELGLDGERIV